MTVVTTLDTTNFNLFRAAESTLSTSFSPTGATGPAIFELFADTGVDIPYHVRTGQQSFGAFAERKSFRYIEFHSVGLLSNTMKVRVYIDGRYVSDGTVTTTETPNRVRRMNMPIGVNAGYAHDIEFCGASNLRAVEFAIEPMASTS